MISGSMLYFMCSSSTILLVRYALVSTKFEIMCLSMLSFPVGSARFVKYPAQSAAFSLAQIGVPLASVSSSSMSSSFILICLIAHSSLIVSCSSVYHIRAVERVDWMVSVLSFGGLVDSAPFRGAVRGSGDWSGCGTEFNV